MDEGKGKQLLFLFFLAACATIAWTEVKKHQQMPPPSRFVGAGLTYGILTIVTPLFGAPVTALVGGGFYLVLLYRYFNNGSEGPSGGGIVGSQIDTALNSLTVQAPPPISPNIIVER